MQSWIHVLEWRATVHADQAAVRDDRGDAYTYRELLDAVERRAGGWAELGIRPGQVVMVVAKNSADFFVHTFALMRAGALPAFVNWRISPGELAELTEIFAPAAVVAEPGFHPLVEHAAGSPATRVSLGAPGDGWIADAALDAPPPPRPVDRLNSTDPMVLLHTSGTTGKAKVIPLVHGDLIRTTSAFAIEIGDQVAGSHHLQLMPLFHLGGFGQALQCFLTAGTLHVHTGFDPVAVVDAIERDRIEFFTAGPSLIDMLVAEVRRRDPTPDLSGIREIQYGSAPITPSSLRAAIEVLGCRFRQIYGNTESQSMISLLAPHDHDPDGPHLASAGQVSFGWEVAIVDPSGAEVPPGEPGELLIRSDMLFPGYWHDPEATAAAFTDDGWYRTGDVGRLTPDRYLFILDRAKDMIISGGENIYPAEVEAVLAAHPDVAEVAVIGVPDARWGEAVHTLVVPASERLTPDELIDWCRRRLAHFKCPKSVEIVTELPRTNTGKVLKRELRLRHRQGVSP